MTFTTPGDEGRLPRSPSLAHPPTSESFDDLLDATSQQHHELVLFRDLDGYFSEPETARRALEVARQAREWLGEVDPTHPCENQHQVFRSYKQGMEAILAEYLVRSKAELPVEALWLAAKRKHERGTDVDGSESAAASVTLTHLLASQNPESFLELMRRPVKAQPQSAPRDHAAGGSCGGPFPEERGRVERQAAAHWGSAFAAGVRPGSRRGGGPARRRGDESSSRSWKAGPGTAQQPTTSYALPPPIPAPPAAAEAVASSRPSSLAAAAPAAAPAGCGKKPGKSEGWFANDGCFLLAACGAKKTAPPGGGEGGWGTRRLDTEDEEEEKEYAPSSLRPELAAAAERTDGRRMLSAGSSEVCSVAERDRSATPGKPQKPLQDGLWGGGGCHDRLLPAQAWFAEADAGGWVSVPATSLGGRSGDMDLGSTFGTDNAVASPRDLLFQSSRDVAFELDQKKSSSNTNSGEGAHGLPLRLSPSSGNSTPHDVDGHGHGHDDYDDDSTSVDSEEIFPEPDPFDPADGGLPCLSRRPLGDWGVDIQGNLRSATGLPAETYFKAGVLSYD